MGEQSINTNPWAEKLQQVSLPEQEEAKQKMLQLLEKEIPSRPETDYKRWVLVIILLLLLLGVCNCPGRVSFTKTTGRYPAAPGSNGLPVNTRPGNGAMAMAITTGNKKANPANNNNPVAFNAGTPRLQAGVKSVITALYTSKKQRNHKQSRHTRTTYGHETATSGGGVLKSATVHMNKNERQAGPAAVINSGNDTVNKIDTAARAVITGDTTLQKTTAATDSTKKKKVEKGWAIATGFNQSFPTGHRQNINLGDYIPVLQLRYHLNEKWYVQAELAVHAPQFVNDLPLEQRSDSSGPGSTKRHSVFLEKLIYWQIPLGVYYSPFKNVYTGAGIRPGILSNAIGLYEDRVTTYPATIVLSSKTQSLKSDSGMVYYKSLDKMDWQWYADINYHWKQLVAGLRYNRGIGSFINTTIPGAAAVRAGNNSAQLFIRYTPWRQRPGKKLPVK